MVVNRIINKWDPIDLLPYAPNDEYEEEIQLITDFIKNNKEITIYTLGIKIKRIFTKRFGSDVFRKSDDECIVIAKNIFKSID